MSFYDSLHGSSQSGNLDPRPTFEHQASDIELLDQPRTYDNRSFNNNNEEQETAYDPHNKKAYYAPDDFQVPVPPPPLLKKASTHVTPQWAGSPRVLSKLTIFRILNYAWDIILILIPLAFVVLGTMAAILDGKSTSNYGRKVERAILLAPTIFPIVFAALAGRFFKIAALWKAERGIELGSAQTLEQLIGCQSLFSTVERQVLLHDYSILSISILLFWALSPLGGQAGLRLLGTVEGHATTNSSVRYLSALNQLNSAMQGAEAAERMAPSYVGPYLASIMSPETAQTSTMDIWGNVKIPSMNHSTLAPDSEGWRSVDYTKDIRYSSLIGIPVAGIPSSGNSTFPIESRYYDVSCASNKLTTYTAFIKANHTLQVRSSSLTNNSHYALFYATNLYSVAAYVEGAPGISISSFFIDTQTEFQGGNNTNPKSLIFGSMASPTSTTGDNSMSLANCTFQKRDVISNVTCTAGKTCRVFAMKPSENQTRYLDYLDIINYGSNLMLSFPLAAGQGSEFASNPTERWINNSASVFGYTMNEEYQSLWKLRPSVLESRLGLLLNTYWQSTYAPSYINGDLSSNLTYYDTLDPTSLNGAYFNASASTVTRSTGEIYRCNYAWLSILLLASLFLEACAVGAFILRQMTVSPDVLGYVSSLTRDNPYTSLPPGGSHLDGLERARLLKRVPVCMGDVRPDREVGHIALVSYDRVVPGVVGRLKKGRLYQ
ncbi:MAG: hypothetical protein M1834_004966 [Cirrosporium novae-zelandiae]|nr:MAG: hypothetical protein M1834_004966 [Cirrosporium novae-zelandiae]